MEIEKLFSYAEQALGPELSSVLSAQGIANSNSSRATAETVVNSLFQQLQNGNAKPFAEMLSGMETSQNHEVVQNLSPTISNDLATKLNIDSRTAQRIAMVALPIVLNMFNKRASGLHSQGGDFGSSFGKIFGSMVGKQLGQMAGGQPQRSGLPLGSILSKMISVFFGGNKSAAPANRIGNQPSSANMEAVVWEMLKKVMH